MKHGGLKHGGLIGIAAFGLVAVVGMLAAPCQIAGVALPFALCSDARLLLERLGLPEGAMDVSPVDEDDADGNMPEMAARSFRLRSDARNLSRFYLERCRKVGLSEASKESAQLEATTLCEASQPGSSQAVLLFTDCSGEACRVTLRVQWLRI